MSACRPVERALNNEVMLDGSSIAGFRTIETSDMYFYPDRSTFKVLPWTEGDRGIARLICDIYNPDGTPFDGCPRNNLKRVLAEAEKLGFRYNVGPELEFFLFERDENGNMSTRTHDAGGYYDLGPDDRGEIVRGEVVDTLEKWALKSRPITTKSPMASTKSTLNMAKLFQRPIT